ncbi:MAG: TIGR02996 domain-containing protein [Planctomycetaceae bacterium]|nr:TIGR02996 domain-containing protein [Planctomycetaceae bacterium]
MGARKPKPIPYEEQIWPIYDNPLDMSRRLAFADWLDANGHRQRADWVRLCCGDCQYTRDLRISFTNVDWTTVTCYCSDPLWHPQQNLAAIQPDWWQTPPDESGYQRVHFGRIMIGELGDPRWLYEGDWLTRAWREGWLELLSLHPKDEEQFNRIADIREECQAIPFLLDTTRTRCEQPPEKPYRRVLPFEGLHGLILCPSELALKALRNFAKTAPNLRYLQLLSLQKRPSSIRILEQLPQLAHLRSLLIGTSHPDDDSMKYVTATKQVEYLGLYGKRLTNRGLEGIPEMSSLRYLSIDVPGVSRAAIERLRQNCPSLTIQVEWDMRRRIGPA